MSNQQIDDLTAHFRAVKRSPGIDLVALLGAVESMRDELHELLDAPPTVTDNGPPTVRSGDLVIEESSD